MRDFAIDVDLKVQRGITVMLGPSGHGKTSVLNMIAGIAAPSSGWISIDDTVLYDAGAQIDIPPESRGVGYVFQDYALFPHLSVFDNIAFGLRTRRIGTVEVRRRVMQMLERLAIPHLKDAFPIRLSAGQRQRVAMGRTLIVEPRVMLMDEPLGALDVQLRAHVRSELKSLLLEYDIPAIVVTHDPMDAIGLGSTVVVMEHGRVIQSGTYETLLSRPATRFVAEFVEVNAYSGRVVVVDANGDALLRLDGGIEIAATLDEPVDKVLVVIHPWDLMLSRVPDAGSLRNVLKCRVANISTLRDRVRVMVNTPIRMTAEISRPSLDALRLSEGEEIFIAFKSTAVRVLPNGSSDQERGSNGLPAQLGG
jgi:molybdate transport system ATP-binding protein